MASKSHTTTETARGTQEYGGLTVAEAEQVEAGMSKIRPCTEGCGRTSVPFKDGRCQACGALAGYLQRRLRDGAVSE